MSAFLNFIRGLTLVTGSIASLREGMKFSLLTIFHFVSNLVDRKGLNFRISFLKNLFSSVEHDDRVIIGQLLGHHRHELRKHGAELHIRLQDPRYLVIYVCLYLPYKAWLASRVVFNN